MAASDNGQTGTALIHGAALYYEVRGEGEPLLLLHAGVADSRMWDEQVGVLAQHFRVIRYDLRGFGRSPMPAGAFAHYEDAHGLLAFLEVEKAHLLGLSFGSQVALDFALAYPQRVARLVLGAPSVGGQPLSTEMLQFFEQEERALEQGDLAAATELNLRMWVEGPQRTSAQVDPGVRERVREMQYHAFTLPVTEDVKVQRLTPPASTRLGEVRAPALILVGDQDVEGIRTVADRLEAEIPGARKVVMPGVAHMLNMEKPEAFNRIVLDFLQEPS